ncbi:MAG: efflux RND transporter periplasmic adaptor subunit [Bryobacteraceae bacterium]|nr:efflux RND transporter periplasmic adaptor subunit [Bryobacteraceae bacterium]
MRRRPFSPIFPLVILAASSLYVGCASNAQSSKGAQGQEPPPAVVEVIEAKQADVPVFSEFPAQTYARNQVDVRGRVTGYVEKWLFKPGSVVTAGQPLYVLDLRPYRAAVQQAQGNVQQQEADVDFARRQVSMLQAEANLASAEANLVKAQQDYQRFKPLVEQDAAARRDLEAAEAALRAAEATVRANKANVEQTRLQTQTQIQGNEGKLEALRGALQTANLNLEYGTIKAPIGGLIGDTTVAVGGLVNPTAATPLTTIMPLDPIWVRLQMSETQFLAYGRRKASGDSTPITLMLADETEFGSKGRIENSSNQVDSRTGTLELQASFPNPGGRLLPGQFGRVRFQTAQRQGVIVVPQRAVQQQQNIQAVMTVGPDNKVQVRAVKTAERVGDGWVIEQGIKPGDRVIVEGQLRVRPGGTVTPRPFKGK